MFRKILRLTLMGSIFTGCYSPAYLHPCDVIGRKIEVKDSHGQNILIIKGLCGHSALGIKRLETAISNNTMQIRFSLKLKGNGNLNERILIPSGIARIVWEDVVLWQKLN